MVVVHHFLKRSMIFMMVFFLFIGLFSLWEFFFHQNKIDQAFQPLPSLKKNPDALPPQKDLTIVKTTESFPPHRPGVWTGKRLTLYGKKPRPGKQGNHCLALIFLDTAGAAPYWNDKNFSAFGIDQAFSSMALPENHSSHARSKKIHAQGCEVLLKATTAEHGFSRLQNPKKLSFPQKSCGLIFRGPLTEEASKTLAKQLANEGAFLISTYPLLLKECVHRFQTHNVPVLACDAFVRSSSEITVALQHLLRTTQPNQQGFILAFQPQKTLSAQDVSDIKNILKHHKISLVPPSFFVSKKYWTGKSRPQSRP